MEVMKDDYICRIEVVKILQKAYAEGRIKAKDGCVSVLDDINSLPKADVQSVKHGQWVCEFYNDVFDVYQADCSVCKKESTDKYDKVSESYEYCPHCGARMDLKDGDTNG